MNTFLHIVSILFLAAWFVGIFKIKATPKFKKWLNDFHDGLWKLSQPDELKGADYGCLEHDASADFKATGSIIPINGYITWHMDKSAVSRTISYSDTIKGVTEALSLIEGYMGNVKFKRVNSKSESQVTLGFYGNGEQGLPRPFGNNTLAYAFLANNTTAKGLVSDMFFNEKYKWAINHGNGRISFKKVFLHELLHALGLHHQTHTRAGILYPSYNGGNTIIVTQDTINGLKYLYGKYAGPKIDIPDDKPDVDDKPDTPDCPPCNSCCEPCVCAECDSCCEEIICPECPDPIPCPDIKSELKDAVKKDVNYIKELIISIEQRLQ